jgi:hypothetical protein
LLTWKGEPLLLVRQLGFNGVWLGEAPTSELLAEAEKLGLWVVAMPLSEGEISGSMPQHGTSPQFALASHLEGWGWNRLLAWNLGHQQTRKDLPTLQQAVERIRILPVRNDAASVCHVLEGTREISRVCDLLVLERPLWEEGLGLRDWAEWIQLRSELARPGTPFWCGIPVHLAPWILEQLRLAGVDSPGAGWPSWQALRAAAFLAIGTGARGLVFTTADRLDGSDTPAAVRRTTLQLLQSELEMIEPFLSGAGVLGRPASLDGNCVGILLRTDRARLLCPLRLSEPTGAEGKLFIHGTDFVLPGIPEAYRAYLVLPGAVRPVRHRRVAGGMLVQMDEYALGSHLLLTNDPTILTTMNQRAAQAGPTAAGLLRRLVREQLDLFRCPDGSNPENLPAASAALLPQVQQHLAECDDRFRLNDYAGAWLAAQRAIQMLSQNRGPQTEAGPTPMAAAKVSHPGNWCFFSERKILPAACPAPGTSTEGNLLPGGDFEDLNLLVSNGWRHFQNPGEPAIAMVLQSRQAAYRGQNGLEISVKPPEEGSAAALLETPPAWIVTPPVAPPAGGWVRISLWVRVPEQIQASVDGLLVADSFGGLPMGLRVRKTQGWQPLEIYRRIPPGRPLEILIALTGYGSAFIDDLRVEVLP